MDLSFPIVTDPDTTPEQKADALFRLQESGESGFYPVGTNNFWHGGVHFVTDEPLRAIGEGEVVAYRINEAPRDCEIAAMRSLDHHVTRSGLSLVKPSELTKLHDESLSTGSSPGAPTHYSNGFVLIRHKYKTPRGAEIVFYSLYMHLLPLAFYSDAQHFPSIFHASRHIVIEKSDGSGVNVYDEDEPTKKVGLIPANMIFTMDTTRTPSAEWSAGRPGPAYRHVAFQGFSGFAASANAASVSGDQYRQTVTTKDKPSDPGDMGLNVHESDDPQSPVIRILHHGTRVHFATEPPRKGRYNRLVDGGFIFYSDKTIKTDKIVDPERYDAIVVPGQPIRLSKGDIVGYAGPYLTARNVCHFEIFLENIDFRGARRDDWGPRTFKVPSDTVLLQREPVINPDVRVNFKTGDRVKLVESDARSGFKKISGRALTGETAHGWIALAAAGEHQGYHRYRLSSAVPSLAADDGSAVAVNAEKGDVLTADTSRKKAGFLWVSCPLREVREGWTDRELRSRSGGLELGEDLAALHALNPRTAYEFKRAAGQTGKDVFIREPDILPDDYPYVHSDGTSYLEVPFVSAAGNLNGWVSFNNPNVETFSDYDWPLWRAFSDPSAYSLDGFCDVRALLDLLHGENGEPLSDDQIKRALSDAATAPVLRRAFTAHPTEWDSTLDDTIGKWNRLADWGMPEAILKDTKKHFKQLQFWSEVRSKGAHLPEPDLVWHAHPIGFILHLKSLMGVTAAQIKAIYAPSVKDDDIDKYVVPLNTAMRTAKVSTRQRQAHFFAQIGEESNRLASTIEDDDGGQYNAEKFVKPLGNAEEDDGCRFRGRGLIQVTGRANSTFYMHDRIGRFFQLPPGAGTEAQLLKQLVESPEFLRISEEPELAADSAGWYWSECTSFSLEWEAGDSAYSFHVERAKASAPTRPVGTPYTFYRRRLKNCNASADSGISDAAVKKVLSRIGGEPTSLSRRQAYFWAAKRVLLE